MEAGEGDAREALLLRRLQGARAPEGPFLHRLPWNPQRVAQRPAPPPPEPQVSPLQRAILEGNAVEVERLFTGAADVSALPCLAYAAEHGQDEIVGLLLGLGVGVESPATPAELGLRPLAAAAGSGHVPVVQRLLSHGAEVDMRDAQGRTPLMAASAGGHLPVVALLLEHQADTEVTDIAGETALTKAITNARGEVFDLLVERGVDAAALGVALAQRQGDAVEKILAVADLDAMLLHYARRDKCSHITGLLLAYGANPAARDREGATALILASRRNDDQAVLVLLNHGVQLEAEWVAEYGVGLLVAAAALGNRELAEGLLKQRVNPNGLDDKGFTPLVAAVRERQHRLAQLLLNSGADAGVPGGGGRSTPIVCAAGSVELVRLLLHHGASPGALLTRELRQLALRGRCDRETLKLLLSHQGARVSDDQADQGFRALVGACMLGDSEVVTLLLDKGADPSRLIPAPDAREARDPGGARRHHVHRANARRDLRRYELPVHTPLTAAAGWGHVEIVRILLARGCDPDRLNLRGLPALLEAVSRGVERDQPLCPSGDHAVERDGGPRRADVMEALLEGGAGVDARTLTGGETSLMIAAREGCAEVVTLLLRHGASTDLRDNQGVSARDHASPVCLAIIMEVRPHPAAID
jgi:ankyrin repeat domain-containing protein 50